MKKLDAKKEQKDKDGIILSSENIQKTVIILVIIFEITLIIILFLSYIFTDINVNASITTIATMVMAFCTAFNVYIISKHSELMNSQLDEMKLDRKLQDRPMPWIYDNKIIIMIEPPKLFHRCGTEISYVSRYYADFDIINISQYPIPSLNVSCAINLDKEKYLTSTQENISGISASSKNINMSFMFSGDDDSYFYSKLREENSLNYPTFHIRMIYNSIAGGHFKIVNHYTILPPKFEEETLISWHTAIAKIRTQYENEIKKHDYLYNNGGIEDSNELWKKLSESTSKEITRKEPIKLTLSEIPGSLTIESISDKEYENIMSNSFYKIPIGKKPICNLKGIKKSK